MEGLSQTQFEALERGDEGAFEEIYRQYYEPVYYLALKTLQRPHDAEDAVQQTFLKAFESLSNLKNYQSFRTWLFRIAHHECINILRTRRSIQLTEDALWGEFSKALENDLMLPQEYTEHKDLIRLIRTTIDALPQLQREALTLEIVHGLSMEQIAEVTESNVNTVKSRIYYARQKIKNAVRAHEQESKIHLDGIALVPLSVVFLRAEQEEPPAKKKIDLGWKQLRRQLDSENDSIDKRIASLLPAPEKSGFGMAAKITAGLLAATAIVTSVGAAVSNTPGGRFGNTAGSQDGEIVPAAATASSEAEEGTEPTEGRAQPLPRAEIAPAAYEAAQAIAEEAPYDVPAPNLADENDEITDEQITPPATQAPTTAPATQAPTESPLSPVYSAYRELLDNEHFALEEFGNFNGSVRQIALAEIYGEDTPELLFLTGSPGDSSCQLVVATYRNGGTTVLNRTYNIPMDSGFGLFLRDGALYSCIADANTNGTSEVSYYRYDDSSTLPYHYNILQDTLLMHMNDNNGYHYSLSDAGEVTENEFNTAQSELLDKVDAVVFTLNSEKLPGTLRTAIGRAEQLGMTTAEAGRALGAE